MVAAAVVLLLLATGYAAAAASDERGAAALAFLAMFAPAALVIRWSWRRDDARAVFALVAFALLLRVPFAFAPPRWSNDAYRYVWDGRLALRGVDPRGIVPLDPSLAPDRAAPLWPYIDLRTIPTVYPPLAIGLFEAAAAIDGDGLRGAKIVMIAGDLLAVAALFWALRRRRLPRGRMAIYALHPLVLVSFAGDAHVEAFAIAGVVWALAGPRAMRIVGLAVGILTKLYPVVLLPLIARLDGRAVALAAAAVIVAYVPAFATGHPLGSLGNYLGAQRFNEAFTALLGVRGALVLFALAIAAAVFAMSRGASLVGAALLAIVAYLLCTPNVLPWYAAVVPAIVALLPRPFAGRFAPAVLGVLAWSATVVLAFGVPWFVRAGTAADVWLRAIEYAPIVAGIAWTFVVRQDGRDDAP